MWIVFGIIYIAIFVFLLCKKSKCFYNPVFWMTMSAVFVIGMYYTSGYAYKYPLRASGLLYYLGVIICFVIGYFGAQKFKLIGQGGLFSAQCNVLAEKTKAISNKVQETKCWKYLTDKFDFLIEKISGIKLYKYVSAKMSFVTEKKEFNRFYSGMNKRVYFLIAFVGGTIFLIDFCVHNTLFSDDLHTGAVMSSIGVLGKICLLLGIIIWLCDLADSVQNNKGLSVAGCCAAIMYFIPALLTSGRQSFILFIVATVAMFMYSLNVNKEYRYLKHFMLCGIIGVGLIVVFCVFVAITRQSVNNKAALFESMFNCVIPEATEKLFLGMGAVGMFFCEIISYYSHELPMFQVFLDNWDSYPMLGASQFQLISQNINQDSAYSFTTMWEKLDLMSENADVYSHVWRTISANCIIDYGIIGGLIFMVILGYLAGRVYKNVMENNRLNNQVMLAMVNAGAFFSMQFSPIVEGYWYFPILWLLIGLPVVNFVVKGVIKK